MDDGTDLERKVGEAKFAIYPRTNAPRINVTVSRGENMYHYTSIMTLLRTVSTENLFMHCGRLRCTVSLREAIPYNGSSTTPKTPVEEVVRSQTSVKSRNDTQVSFDKGSQTFDLMANSADKMSLVSSEKVSLPPSPPRREEYSRKVRA